MTNAGCPEAGELLLREPVGDAETGVRWEARIRGLIGPPSRLESMTAQVASFAREHWSWQRCVQRYGALFRACAADRLADQRPVAPNQR